MKGAEFTRPFSELVPDPGWAYPTPPPAPVVAPELLPALREEARRFEEALVAQGIARPNSARTYRKALECVAKQAQRHRGEPLVTLSELFTEDLIAAVVRDDRPFDATTPQLSRYTMRQRRVVLDAYLRAVGIPGRPYEETRAMFDGALRQAATRRGYRFVLGSGRPELRDRYVPPVEDVARFLASAFASGNAYVGPRLAAAAALAVWEGLRAVSILAVDGTDFRWHGERLFLAVWEKAAGRKRQRREIEVRPPVVCALGAYCTAFNVYAGRLGRRERIGFGVPDAFFRDINGGRWSYGSLRAAVARRCDLVGVPRFSIHALRHLYATGLGATVPVEEAAKAGGWQGVLVFLRHYAHPERNWNPVLPLSSPFENERGAAPLPVPSTDRGREATDE